MIDTLVDEARRALASGDGLLCQSCCLDVLDLDPEHAEAARLLLIAMTSGDATPWAVTTQSPKAWLGRVADPTERRFLEGMLAYRRAVAMQAEAVPGFVVRGWLDKALAAFDEVLAAQGGHVGALTRRRLVQRVIACQPALADR